MKIVNTVNVSFLILFYKTHLKILKAAYINIANATIVSFLILFYKIFFKTLKAENINAVKRI